MQLGLELLKIYPLGMCAAFDQIQNLRKQNSEKFIQTYRAQKDQFLMIMIQRF